MPTVTLALCPGPCELLRGAAFVEFAGLLLRCFKPATGFLCSLAEDAPPCLAAAAGGRPRFSLVWKLALLPRQPGQALCLARPEWGPPMSFGSAARVDAVKRQLAAEQRQQRQQQQDGGSGGAGGHAEQP